LAEQKTVQKPKESLVVVDATNCIAGRMCSHVSKLLLQGNRVNIVNAEKAMLSGNRYKTIELYKEHLGISSVTNPIHGPFHPRRPDTILSKMVRGMMPKRKPGGIAAFKRLRVYMGVPERIKGAKMQSFADSKISKPESYYISIGEVAKQIGWKRE
jgi:large subunit ribosomal protein L13